MELERQREAIARRGYGLAAISYDPVGVLKAFAERRGVALPMLSDEASAVIRRFGLLNPEYPEGDLAHGVPYPGTFVVDAQGVIRQRIFEIVEDLPNEDQARFVEMVEQSTQAAVRRLQ